MKVQAKCTHRAWDSMGCMLFIPGNGPLPGGLYEIEHDGALASLKVGQRYVKYDKEGKAVGDPVGGTYVFEFDRALASRMAAIPGAAFSSPLPERSYTCNRCGSKFNSLNALGTHSHSVHNDEPEDSDPSAEPEAEPSEAPRTNAAGDTRGLGPRHCKDCGLAFDSLNALVMHKTSCHGRPEVTKEVTDTGQAPPA